MFSYSIVSLSKKVFVSFPFLFLSEIALIARGRTFYCTIQSFFTTGAYSAKHCLSIVTLSSFSSLT